MRTKLRSRSLRVLGRSLLAAAALGALGACHMEPWVKPYERDHLADPVMSFDRDPVSSVYTDHVHEVREGSRGATGCGGRRLRLQLMH